MIKVFVTEDTRIKNVDIEPLKISSPIKTIVIEAICAPTVCSKVLNQDVKIVSSNYEHLKWIELADSSPETTKCIDVYAHYLSHRAVVEKNRETTKITIVFDGSAHSSNEPSVNDVLCSGPCLLLLIFDILVRFRTVKIGIVADVKQAFH